MAFQKLDDIEIEGIKITNIYRECEYYYRTSGYNYIFYFHCDLADKDAVYDLCKKAFPEGKDHVRYDGNYYTYAVDHDDIMELTSETADNNEKNAEHFDKGCNWVYYVNEGNDN